MNSFLADGEKQKLAMRKALAILVRRYGGTVNEQETGPTSKDYVPATDEMTKAVIYDLRQQLDNWLM